MNRHPTSSNPVERPPQSLLVGVCRLVSRLLTWILLRSVRFYQVAISPLLGNHCRYIPSCSEYFVQAVQKYGPVRGAAKGILRICRCHPWHPGGYDPP